MSRSSEGSSGEHSKEGMITLPRIRDIFGEQLSAPSPHSSPRPSSSNYISGSPHAPFTSEPRSHASASSRAPSLSPDIRFGRGESTWNNSPSHRVTAPGLRPSLSYGAPLPEAASQRPMREHRRSQESSPALMVQPRPPSRGYHYSSATEPRRYLATPSGMDPARSSAAAWTEHRRRDSMESAWSSHSSSSAASTHPRSIPPPLPSNALQFQPLPHSHMHLSRSAPYSSARNSAQTDYQSPFGVLIADADPRGPSVSDPQRTAIIRTLRASGIQGSFQINFDDSSSQSASRYSCEYCGKGFARPSSLRIHINSHTGEKPFQCPYPDCGRRFSVHSNMRRHYRVHGGNAPKTGEASEDELVDE